MSKHSVEAGDIAGLLKRFAQLKEKPRVRTGRDFPFITIHEAGLDGFWIYRVLPIEGSKASAVWRYCPVGSHQVDLRWDHHVTAASVDRRVMLTFKGPRRGPCRLEYEYPARARCRREGVALADLGADHSQDTLRDPAP